MHAKKLCIRIVFVSNRETWKINPQIKSAVVYFLVVTSWITFRATGLDRGLTSGATEAVRMSASLLLKKKKFKGKLTGVGGWGKGDVLIHAYERFFLNLMLLFLASNICRRATYFSSCSLSGETLDCFHLFNFHVPLSGFLWSEPLCHQWHLIDVFHINQRVIPQIDDISFKCDSLVFVCVSLTRTQSCTLK